MNIEQYLSWGILLAYIFILLGIDFFVLHKKGTVTTTKKAIGETLFFAANALLFSGILYWLYNGDYTPSSDTLPPSEAVVKYLSGYIIELSLSVDNLFVIAMIFTTYKIPIQHQHRLLFLGILGALVFRAVLISLGLVLVHEVKGIGIFFGLFLLYTAINMLKKEETAEEYHKPKLINRLFNISPILDGDKLRTTVDGKKMFTVLFGALITIEFTDLLFALDSIPAIFAVTTDPYLVFSSNIFAIMGLRSLYFFLANMLEKFSYLKYSVFSILVFVALKLMTADFVDIPEWFSLLFIVISLLIGIWISIQKMNSETTKD